MMEVRLISPNDLRQWWRFVRPGLEMILHKTPEGWIPEDVYTDCFNGKSMLWVGLVDARPIGFMVLQPRNDALHVWCAYLSEVGYFDAGWQHLVNIAQHGDAKRLTFESWRPGWTRKAKQLGFKPRSWALEV
jgi:hypothetical protein